MPVRMLNDQEKAELIARVNSGDHGRRARPMLEAEFDRSAIDEEKRTISLSFSSEAPVERYWGVETLKHTASAVDLSRLKPGAFGPVLMDHNAWDGLRHIGVVEEARVDEKRGKVVGTVRLSQANPNAEIVWKDILGGIRGSVSIGYEILDLVLQEEKKDAPPKFLVTKWAIYEVSFVSVPADTQAGVGRSALNQPAAPVSQRKEGDMPPDNPTPTGAAAQDNPAPINPPTPTQDRAASDVNPALAERKRVEDITAIGDFWKTRGGPELAQEFIRNGRAVDEFRSVLLERLAAQPNPAIRPSPDPDIGLKPRDVQRFSLWKLVRALVVPEEKRFWDHKEDGCGFEREVCQAFMQRTGRVSNVSDGFIVPHQVLRAKKEQRDLLVGTPSLGGYTVETTVLGSEFIELLRNAAPTMQLARLLTGLTGNIQIPKKTAGNTAYWVAENVAVTESNATFGQLALSPKTVGGAQDISRLLAMQSSVDVEALVTEDLVDTIAGGIDVVAIKGGGSGEPSGILTLPSGIGNVNMGDNGGSLTWAKIIEFESTQGTNNAVRGKLAWLTNPKVVGAAKSTMRTSTYGEIPLWNDMAGDRPLNGYPVYVTNNVPSNYTKGTHTNPDMSALIFGNWNDLVIALWDGLDIGRDTAAGFLAGTVRIRVLQSIDVGLRIPGSFTISDEIITS